MISIATESASVEMHVTLYRIARIRAAQALIPFAVVASIFARRSLNPVAVTVALLLQLATLVTFLSARRGLGWQRFRLDKGAGSFGPNLRLARTRVERWTIHGRLARLYCQDISLRLRGRTSAAESLDACLRCWLGAPLLLERRGSARARGIAATVALSGLAFVAAAFALDNVPLVVAGILCVVLGGATFGALSQRVARL
jgi:hypothetical protein